MISLGVAKAHLRVLHDYEDALIIEYIEAASDAVEQYLNRRVRLDLQTYVAAGGTYPSVALGQDVLEVTSIDIDGAPHTGASSYRYLTDNVHELVFARPVLVLNSLVINYTTGIRPIPGSIKQACLLYLGHFHANRSATITGSISVELKLGAEKLLNPYRRF